MTRIDAGCGTPENSDEKDINRRLLNIYSPILHFHEQERFFPVDITSTIKHSSLWTYDPDQKLSPDTCINILDKGHITNPDDDLQNLTNNHFTTVTDLKWVTKSISDYDDIYSPTPEIEEIYRVYKDEIIPELTIYGMVCKTKDTTNSHLFANTRIMNALVEKSIADGVLLTYYFFFPAYESEDLVSEGDWCGVALLLKSMPNSIGDLESNLEFYSPVLSCYFTKSIDGYPPSPMMVAQPNGIRRWIDVNRDLDENLNVRTHPIVYISKGRHQCYYEPIDKMNSLFSPWVGAIFAFAVEEELYTPAPVDYLVRGGTEIKCYHYVIFPPLAIFVALASACKRLTSFDKSGVPLVHNVHDVANDSGYMGLTTSVGSTYPKNPSGEGDLINRILSIKLEYVDLSDKNFAAIWQFPGAWGSATKKILGQTNKNELNKIQGVRRPLLGAWFNFNLFVDHIYGPGGEVGLIPHPSDI